MISSLLRRLLRNSSRKALLRGLVKSTVSPRGLTTGSIKIINKY
ncbi:MAG: hypothetical protein ACEY3D_00910 [Rickettsia sp.]